MGKAKPKVEVNEYYMSIHQGFVTGPTDAWTHLHIGEKLAWSGYVSTQGLVRVNKRKLFGGEKKEGGVAGNVYYLPGYDTQLLPDTLAHKFGRDNGADCPGFRGLTSLFFFGDGTGLANDFISGIFPWLGIGGRAGFLWGANTPYLKSSWATFQRAPKGLNQSYARILRPGYDHYPQSTAYTGESINGGMVFSPDGQTMAYFVAWGDIRWYDVGSRTMIGESGVGALVGGVGALALDSDSTAYEYGVTFTETFLAVTPIAGIPVKTTVALGEQLNITNIRVFGSGDEADVYGCYWDGAAGYLHNTSKITSHPQSMRDICIDDDGEKWGLFVPSGSSNAFTLEAMSDGTQHTFTGVTTRNSNTAARVAYVAAYDHFFVALDGYVYIIDADTMTLTSSTVAAWGSTTPALSSETDQTSFWINWSQYSLEDGALLRAVSQSSWPGSTSNVVYDEFTHSVWGRASTGYIDVYELDRAVFDANPSHMIYECLTNSDWGMGETPTLIDIDSFEDVGLTLYNEQLGLSMIWLRQTTVEEFVTEVIDHIQATIFVNPRTGLITIKLIRGDYDIDTLRHITIDNADLTNFQRKAWGEIINEINVTWTNPENEQEETVTVQDLGAVATQGGVISDSRNYYGIRSKEKAVELAARDLRVAASPLASCEVELDRTHWDILPGEVVKVTWAEHGLAATVMRFGAIDYGRPGEPIINGQLVEDVFSLTTATYSVPPGSEWEGAGQTPLPMDYSRIITMPAFLAMGVLSEVELSADYPEVVAGVLASTEQTDASSYDLVGPVVLTDGTTVQTTLSTNTILGRAVLTNALDAEATSTAVEFEDFIGQVAPAQNAVVFIGNDDTPEAEMEIALITAGTTTFTMKRGLLDTVPKAWAAGTVVWFAAADSSLSDYQLHADGETVTFRLLTNTSEGQLANAAQISGLLTDRPYLPNRPANVQVDGVGFNTISTPVDMIGESLVPVSWANRNRLTEETQVLAWTDASVSPEAGQTTTIKVLDLDGTVVTTHDTLSGTSFDIPIASFADLNIGIVEVSASRTDSDGTFDSLQGHRLYVRIDGVTFDETDITFDTTIHTWDES